MLPIFGTEMVKRSFLHAPLIITKLHNHTIAVLTAPPYQLRLCFCFNYILFAKNGAVTLVAVAAINIM